MSASPTGRLALFRQQLFSDPGLHCYAVLDGASVPDMLGLLERHPTQARVCLFRGEMDRALAAVAPYLVELEEDSPLVAELLGGLGRHWGIFAQSRAGLRELRKHFRTFQMVRGPDGRLLYFRYYDPRVLGRFLPRCDREECQRLFGPVQSYLLEQDAHTLLHLDQQAGELRQSPIALPME